MKRLTGSRDVSGKWMAMFAAALLLFAGCADHAISPVAPQEPDDEITVPGLVVSEARASASASGATSAGSEAEVAYVSAAPGTLRGALSVRVRNVTSGDPATPPIHVSDGGFDPVGVLANSGDQLELAIAQLGAAITYVHVFVPIRRPPIVVRTNPPKGRTDVALTIRPTIVFSEPIDPLSLGPSTVRLLRGDDVVGGTVTLVAGTPFVAELTPDSQLEPLTDYELVVSTAVRDREGDSIGEELRVVFTTGSDEIAGFGALRVSNVTTGGAFDIDGYRVVVTVDGHQIRTADLELNTGVLLQHLPEGELTVQLADVAANCSVSGASSQTVEVPRFAERVVEFHTVCTPPPELASLRLIFSRWDRNASAKLFAMNADGSGGRQLTTGLGFDLGPLLSPDGSRIAFSRETDGLDFWGRFKVYLMDADGNNVAPLTHEPDGWSTVAWDWSPDGTRIATVTGGGRLDLISADGAERRTLVNSSGGAMQPAWSPDGNTIVFSRYIRPVGEFTCDNPSGGYEIWAINADGSNARRLRRKDQCRPGGHLSWSSDGSKILFSDAAAEGGYALWSMNVDGSGVVRIVGPQRCGMDFGIWSPDRKLITMTGQCPLELSEWRVDVFLLNVEDGSLMRVTADGGSFGANFLR